jgi:hypothetical protein
MGTPEYVSPEQATDARTADTRADIYSLGCTLYFVLTGRPPFVEDTVVKLVLAQIEKEPTPLHEVRPDVPAALSAVVARMLAKDPARRYQTPIEVAEALAAFVKPGARREADGAGPPPGVKSPGTGTVMGGGTSKPQRARPNGARKEPAREGPRKEETANPFEDLADAAAAPKQARPAPQAGQPVPAAWYRRSPLREGLAAALVALSLLAAVVFKAVTANGDAIIVLEVDQPGAEVLVDGGKITVQVPGDKQPLKIRVPPGQHTLEVKKGGFVAYTEKIELKAGKSPPIKVRLEPVPATLVVEVDQPGADVLVDGQRVNVTVPGGNRPVEIKVAPGRHKVQVRKDGFQTAIREIEPEAGKSVPIKVSLRRATPVAPARFPIPADVEQPVHGAWNIKDQELVQPYMVWGARLLFGERTWTDYDFMVDAQMTGGNCGFGLMVRNSGGKLYVHRQDGTSRHKDHLIFLVGGFGNTHHYLEQVLDSKGKLLCNTGLGPGRRLRKGEWYTARVSVRGNRVQCYLKQANREEEKLFDVITHAPPAGLVGLMTWDAPFRFRNIKVTDPAGKVLLEGLPDLPPK